MKATSRAESANAICNEVILTKILSKVSLSFFAVAIALIPITKALFDASNKVLSKTKNRDLASYADHLSMAATYFAASLFLSPIVLGWGIITKANDFLYSAIGLLSFGVLLSLYIGSILTQLIMTLYGKPQITIP